MLMKKFSLKANKGESFSNKTFRPDYKQQKN